MVTIRATFEELDIDADSEMLVMASLGSIEFGWKTLRLVPARIYSLLRWRLPLLWPREGIRTCVITDCGHMGRRRYRVVTVN